MPNSQKAAYGASEPGERDQVRFWRERRFDDLECLKARYLQHRYQPHTHDTYAIGVMVAGAEAFRYRGARRIAGPGAAVAVNPGELHDGEPVGEAFAYRMLYPSIALVRGVAEDLYQRPVPAPLFPDAAVLEDPEVAGRLAALHRLMEGHAPKLAVDSAFNQAISLMVQRYGDVDRPLQGIGRESRAVGRARDFIDANVSADITLDQLAAVAGFSRYHFLRAFRRELGITPHAYHMGRRVALAKRLLSGTESLSAVALACGYFDQSHMNRGFKAWIGVTPGQYRLGSNMLQDSSA